MATVLANHATMVDCRLDLLIRPIPVRYFSCSARYIWRSADKSLTSAGGAKYQ